MIKCEIKDNSKQEGKAAFNGTGNGSVEISGDFAQIMNETGMLLAAIIETLAPKFEAISPMDARGNKAALEMAFLKTIEGAAIHFLCCNKSAEKIDMTNLHTFLNNQRGGNDNNNIN